MPSTKNSRKKKRAKYLKCNSVFDLLPNYLRLMIKYEVIVITFSYELD